MPLLKALGLPPTPALLAQAAKEAEEAKGKAAADAVWIEKLRRAARELESSLVASLGRLDDQVKLNDENTATSTASSGMENAKRIGKALFTATELNLVKAPDRRRWDEPLKLIKEARAALDKGDRHVAAQCLGKVAGVTKELAACVADYTGGVLSGAETTTTALEVTAVAGAVAATVVTGGVAAGLEAGVVGTAVAGGVGAGLYGGAQELGTQKGEKMAGGRQAYDFGAVGKRIGKDAVIGFVGTLLGGALSKQFCKMFGSYLSKVITNPELVELGKALGMKGPLPRDFFLTAGQRFVADFLGGAGAAPVTKIVESLLDGKSLPSDRASLNKFMSELGEEIVKQGLIQVFITALAHSLPARRAKGGGTPPPEEPPPLEGKGKGAPQEPAPKPPETNPHKAANDNVEVANDNVEIPDQAQIPLAAGAEGQGPQAVLSGGNGGEGGGKGGPSKGGTTVGAGKGTVAPSTTDERLAHRKLQPKKYLQADAMVKGAEQGIAKDKEYLSKNPRQAVPKDAPKEPTPIELSKALKELPKLDQPDERLDGLRALLKQPHWNEKARAFLEEQIRIADAHGQNEAIDGVKKSLADKETGTLPVAQMLLREASVTVKKLLRMNGPNYKARPSEHPYDEAMGAAHFNTLTPRPNLNPDHLWPLAQIAECPQMAELIEVYQKATPAQQRALEKALRNVGDVKDNLASMSERANQDWKKDKRWSELSFGDGVKYGYKKEHYDEMVGREAKAMKAVLDEIDRLIKEFRKR